MSSSDTAHKDAAASGKSLAKGTHSRDLALGLAIEFNKGMESLETHIADLPQSLQDLLPLLKTQTEGLKAAIRAGRLPLQQAYAIYSLRDAIRTAVREDLKLDPTETSERELSRVQLSIVLKGVMSAVNNIQISFNHRFSAQVTGGDEDGSIDLQWYEFNKKNDWVGVLNSRRIEGVEHAGSLDDFMKAAEEFVNDCFQEATTPSCRWELLGNGKELSLDLASRVGDESAAQLRLTSVPGTITKSIYNQMRSLRQSVDYELSFEANPSGKTGTGGGDELENPQEPFLVMATSLKSLINALEPLCKHTPSGKARGPPSQSRILIAEWKKHIDDNGNAVGALASCSTVEAEGNFAQPRTQDLVIVRDLAQRWKALLKPNTEGTKSLAAYIKTLPEADGDRSSLNPKDLYPEIRKVLEPFLKNVTLCLGTVGMSFTAFEPPYSLKQSSNPGDLCRLKFSGVTDLQDNSNLENPTSRPFAETTFLFDSRVDHDVRTTREAIGSFIRPLSETTPSLGSLLYTVDGIRDEIARLQLILTGGDASDLEAQRYNGVISILSAVDSALSAQSTSNITRGSGSKRRKLEK